MRNCLSKCNDENSALNTPLLASRELEKRSNGIQKSRVNYFLAGIHKSLCKIYKECQK